MIRQIFLMAALASAGGAHAQGGPKSTPPAKEVRFLEDIEVGFAPVKGASANTAKNNTPKTPVTYSGPVAPVSRNPKFSIEDAGSLHLKFAVLLNTEVEAVPALPLMVLIDDWWGTRYRLGGNDRNGIDCSGFTCMLFNNLFQAQIPRTARDQFAATRAIDPAQLREGDLVFFATGGAITHVGFYLQNNKFVHASTSEGVTISDLNDRYWQQRFAGAERT
jgi:cell wall-associated NlpC family hydrolase